MRSGLDFEAPEHADTGDHYLISPDYSWMGVWRMSGVDEESTP